MYWTKFSWIFCGYFYLSITTTCMDHSNMIRVLFANKIFFRDYQIEQRIIRLTELSPIYSRIIFFFTNYSRFIQKFVSLYNFFCSVIRAFEAEVEAEAETRFLNLKRHVDSTMCQPLLIIFFIHTEDFECKRRKIILYLYSKFFFTSQTFFFLQILLKKKLK